MSTSIISNSSLNNSNNSNIVNSNSDNLASSSFSLSSASQNINIPPHYVEGEVYTALYGDWGCWPIRIARTTEVGPSTLRGQKKDQFIVYFFGSKDYGFITEKQIMKYEIKDLLAQKLKTSDLKKMNKAIDEANQWIDNNNKDYPVYMPETKKPKKAMPQDKDYTPTKKKGKAAGRGRGRIAVKKEPLYQQNAEEIFDNTTDNSFSTPTRTKRSPLNFVKDKQQQQQQQNGTPHQNNLQQQSINNFITPTPNVSQSVTPLSHRRKQLEFPSSPFKPNVKLENGILVDLSMIQQDQIENELIHLLGLLGPISLQELRNKVVFNDEADISSHLESISNIESDQRYSLKTEKYDLINETWHGYKNEDDRDIVRDRKNQATLTQQNIALQQLQQQQQIIEQQQSQPQQIEITTSTSTLSSSLTTTSTQIDNYLLKPPTKKPQPQFSPKKKKINTDTLDIITPIKPKFSSFSSNYDAQNLSSDFGKAIGSVATDLLQSNDMDTTIPLLDENTSSLPDFNEFEEEEIECTQSNTVTASSGSSQNNNNNTTTTTTTTTTNTTINNIYFNSNFSNSSGGIAGSGSQHQATQVTQTPPTPPSSHNNSFRIQSTPYSSPGIPATLVVTSPASNRKKAPYYAASSQDDSDSDCVIPPTIPINFGSPTDNNNNNYNRQNHNTSTIILDQTHLKEILNDSEHLRLIVKDSITDLISTHFKQNALKDMKSMIEKEFSAKMEEMKEAIMENVQDQIFRETKKRKKSIQTIIHSLSDMEQTICTLKQNLEKLVD